MRIVRCLTALALILALVFSAQPYAHEAGKGRNGGFRVDAGNYHVELLVDGTVHVFVFVSDRDDKPVPAAGFKATAILLIGGDSQRIELLPADGSKLVGTAPTPVKPGVKGVVQLTAPDGKTSQGKF